VGSGWDSDRTREIGPKFKLFVTVPVSGWFQKENATAGAVARGEWAGGFMTG
jgi:hypothetical protein